jgi:hypothetical protein
MIRRTGIALMVALGLAPPAAASWSPPQQLGGGTSVALSTDGHGNRAIAWAGRGAVQIAFARDGGPFRHARPIPGSEVRSGQNDSQLSVTMDRSGRVLVAWTFFDNRRPGTHMSGDEGCCSVIKTAVVDHGAPHRAVTLTEPTDAGLERLGGMAFGPHGRGAVAVSARVRGTPGAAVALLSSKGRFRLEKLGDGSCAPQGVYFHGTRPAVTCLAAGGLRDFTRTRTGRFTLGPVLFAGNVIWTVATSPNGHQALLAPNGKGGLIGAIRAPGRSFRKRLLDSSAVASRTGLAVADSGRAIASWGKATGALGAAAGSSRRGFGQKHLTAAHPFAEPFGAAVRADGRGLFLYSPASTGASSMDAAFVSPAGRIGPQGQVSATGSSSPELSATAIDSRGAVAAWLTPSSVVVSRFALSR